MARLEISADVDRWVRQIAREEIASLLGLMLRRVQDRETLAVIRDPDAGDLPVARQQPIEFGDLAAIVGEALRDFGDTTTEPGT